MTWYLLSEDPGVEVGADQPWAERWVHQGGDVRGGQGRGFLAVAAGGSGQRAFIKTLTRTGDRVARGRFLREVTAYQTLVGAGVPTLLDHNADHWEDVRVPLFMALEYIDGGNLADWARANGPGSFADALGCVDSVAAVLTRGHGVGVVHRDIKPANIMVGAGGVTDAVLVDFGLSFNHSESDDLTRVGVEVGNRFLRLPEHAFGGRSAVSDVTQLAGICLFILTGTEPRVLEDEQGRMPHQRVSARPALEARFEGRQLRRILAVFDKAFARQEAHRFATSAELVESLHAVEANPNVDDYADLLSQVDEIAGTVEHQRAARARKDLGDCILAVVGHAKGFGLERGLHVIQTGHAVEVASPDPYAQMSVSVTQHGDEPRYVRYQVRRRGSELVVSADAEEIWRGSEEDDSIARAVTAAAARAFLKASGARGPETQAGGG